MKKVFFVLLSLILLGNSISASPNNNFGITASIGQKSIGEFGSYATLLDSLWIGFILNLDESFTIRPSFMFYSDIDKRDYNMGSSPNEEDTVDIFGIQSAFLFTIIQGENYSIYFGPELSYITFNTEDKGSSRSESKRNIVGIYGKIGGQYLITKNFGFFGDIGIGFDISHRSYKNWDSSGTLTSDYEDSQSSFRTSNAYLGAVLYF